MVKSATSLSRSGMRDWLIQRVSAVVLGLYILTLLVFFLFHSNLEYEAWADFFYNPFMQVFTFLALVSLMGHAWVGVWTIFTDYIKPKGLRLFLEVLLVFALLAYLAWGVSIIWR